VKSIVLGTPTSLAAMTTTLIDEFLPHYDIGEHHEAHVAAPPALAYETIRGLDLARSPVTMALLVARGLIALVQPRRARELYGPLVRRPRLTLDDVQRAGFVLLGEQPGREIVLGVVGRFWQPGSGIERVQAREFVEWSEPGFAKGVLNFKVIPAGGPEDPVRSIVSTETRVQCLGGDARRAFRRYWRIIGPFSGLIRRRVLALIKRDAERAARGMRS
jgi:hypothetical protein